VEGIIYEPVTESDDIATGIGLGVGISVAGLLIALAPAVTGFAGVPATICYIVAPVIAAAGLAGCTIEVDKLYKTQHYSTLGIGFLIAAIGVSIVAGQRIFEPAQWIDIMLGIIGYLVVCFGVIALFMGLGGVIGTPRVKAATGEPRQPESSATGQPRQPESSVVTRGESIQIWVAIVSTVISSVIAILVPLALD
jgi:hypothetical protein